MRTLKIKDTRVNKRPSLKNLLKLTAQTGIAAGKVMLFVVLIFGLVNFTLVVYAFIRLFIIDFSWTNVGISALVLLLAIGFTVLACSLTYRYVLLSTIKKVYALTLEQRTKISEDVVIQVETTFNRQQEIHHNQLNQAVDWSKTVYRYYEAVPVFFQSGITQYLNRVPITNYIIDVKEDILAGNQVLAAEKLREGIDTFFEEHIVGSPTNLWTWLLLLIDILVLYGLITWGITAASL